MKNSIPIYTINLLQSSITNGLLPILPLLAIDLGMSKSFMGVYMASSFLLLFVGSILAGYLADKTKNIRTLLIISTSLFIVFLFAHSLVTKSSQLFVVTSLLWFVAGFQSVLINTLQGERAKNNNRGAKYAKLAISSVLGAVIGGLIVGVLLKLFSVKTMFHFLSVIAVFSFISSLLIREIKNTNFKVDSFIRFNKKLLSNKRLMFFYFSSI